MGYPGTPPANLLIDKIDFTDTVVAEHINTLQTEVLALEVNLGTYISTSSDWNGEFDQTVTVWNSLKDRLENIEFGLGEVYANYVQADGGSTIQSTATTSTSLIVKAVSSQTASLVEFQTSAGTVVSKVDAAGNLYTSGKQVVPVVYASTQPSSVPAGTIWVNSTSTPGVIAEAATVPAGGTTGQVLAKSSGTNYATTWSSDIPGNAATATKLATARTINGTSFDGSANVSISVPVDSVTDLLSPFLLGGM